MAKNIFVFPNNKNIIMSAQQANDITDKNLIVIPTRSIPEGVSAVLAFDANSSIDENKENIIADIQTAEEQADFTIVCPAQGSYNTEKEEALFRYGYKKTSFPPGRSFLQSKSTHPQYHFRRKTNSERSKGSL